MGRHTKNFDQDNLYLIFLSIKWGGGKCSVVGAMELHPPLPTKKKEDGAQFKQRVNTRIYRPYSTKTLIFIATTPSITKLIAPPRPQHDLPPPPPH